MEWGGSWQQLPITLNEGVSAHWDPAAAACSLSKELRKIKETGPSKDASTQGNYKV